MTKEVNKNNSPIAQSAAIRAEFERFMLSSAEDAGFDTNLDFTRSDECPESYADGYMQAAWCGFSVGVKSGESNKLELTIISLANGYLQEMEYHLKNPKADGDFITSFQNLMVLAEVAHLADSGLSEEATKILIGIEQQAVKLSVRNGKIHSAITSNSATKLILKEENTHEQ